MVFKVDGFKFAVVSGFELHFDAIFSQLDSKNVDCILVPSVSTFDSYERWKALLCSRAFTHNCYMLRANRIGSYEDKEVTWNFYGDSLLVSPNGEILEHLGNKEELLIVDMSHTDVVQARRAWGFKEAINKRIPL
jgi:predicted amidohydrolase